MNNIFDYATKELSQDAFICWVLNWIKYPKSRLFDLAKDLFILFGEESVNPDQEITIKTQVLNADIVVTLHGDRRIIIIEDKTYTSEHDDQIKKYKDRLSNYDNQKLLDIKPDEKIDDIVTIYFKTGFYYDDDQLMKVNKRADICIDGYQFLKTLEKYYGNSDSEILDSYVVHLKRMLENYEKYGKYTQKYDSGAYYYCWKQIAQYRFMRDVFPEDMWNKKTPEYKVYHGSSFGRPWTEMDIVQGILYPDSDDKHYSDNNGPYFSLRMYEDFNKNNNEKKSRHKLFYDKYKSALREVVEENSDLTIFSWNEIKVGERGNYKESALCSIKLGRYFDKWDNEKESVIKALRFITEAFLKKVSSL